MKKFLHLLFLLCLLLPSAGSLPALGQTEATLTDGGLYRLVNTRSKKAIAYSPATTNVVQQASTPSSLHQLWTVTLDADGYYTFKNYAGGTYIGPNTGGSGNDYHFSATPGQFKVYLNDNDTPADATDDYYTVIEFQDGVTTNMGFNEKAGVCLCKYSVDDGSKWQLQAVEASTATAMKEMHEQLAKKSLVRLVNRSKGSANRTLYEEVTTSTDEESTATTTDYNFKLRTLSKTVADDEIWVIERSDSGYLFRNYLNGHYLNADLGHSSAPTPFYCIPSVNGQPADGLYYINISKAAECSTAEGSRDYVHGDNSNNLCFWNAGDGTEMKSDWGLEPVSVPTADEVKDHFDRVYGYIAPATGQYFKLYNLATDLLFSENFSTNVTYGKAEATGEYLQYWSLEASAEADAYYLRNVQTGRYLASSGQATVETTAEAAAFTFTVNENFLYDRRYQISFGDNNLQISGINTSTTTESAISRDQGYQTLWALESVDLTDEEVAAARNSYEENRALIGQTDVIAPLLEKYFTDNYCTTLKDAYQQMDDADLQTEMDADRLPPLFRRLVLKVKNNTWTEWESEFRLHRYQAYSDSDPWSSKICMSNAYAALTNPTGIVARSGDVIAIMVGRDALPPHTDLAIETVEGKATDGTETTLRPGLNLLPVTTDATLFVKYIAQTHAVDTMRLSHTPLIPIHIEGGRVDGFFELGRHTNAQWQQMQADGLLTAPALQMKGRKVIIHIDGPNLKKYTPELAEELVERWDYIVRTDHSLMGLEEYADRWNDLLGAYNGSSYMHAGGRGSYFNESTMSTICSAEAMLAGGSALWGPAHEFGHNNQAAFNMVGCTEASNNLFSNVVVHEDGRTTTRGEGATIEAIAADYVAKKRWPERDIWQKTRMYFQLYLYFHALGVQPDFYPELFKALRTDGLSKTAGTAGMSGATDYLKFAEKCCEVSQTDLSDFFEAHGFFFPCENLKINDYADYYMTTTQAEIDASLEKMHAYKKPAIGHIFFIDDRIKPAPATYEGAPEGAIRTPYDYTAGTLGDVGQYTDFDDAVSFEGNNYTTKTNTDGSVTVYMQQAPTGNVGYKVVDSEGNLLYFSNRHAFTIPADVVATNADFTVVAALPDGSSVTLTNSGVEANNYADGKVYRMYSLTSDGEKHYLSVNADGQVKLVTTCPTDGTADFVVQQSADDLFYVATADGRGRLDAGATLSKTGRPVSFSLASTNEGYLSFTMLLSNGRQQTWGHADGHNVGYWTRDAGDLVNIYSTTESTQWVFEKRTPYFSGFKVAIGSGTNGNFGTLHLPYAVTLPKELTAHRVDIIPETTTDLRYSPVVQSGGILPALTPVLLTGTAAGSYYLQPAPTADLTTTVESGNLSGTLGRSAPTETSGNFYILVKRNGVVLFVRLSSTDNVINANKAYLVDPTSTASGQLFFTEGQQSGIIDAAERSDLDPSIPLYDLHGRRVYHPLRGSLYIQQGRKVIY